MREEFLKLAERLHELFKNDILENERLEVRLEFDSEGLLTYLVTEHLDYNYDWGDDDV